MINYISSLALAATGAIFGLHGLIKETIMLDPKLLRSDLNSVAERLTVKGYHLDCDAFLSLESKRKELQLSSEALQQERNAYAKNMGALIGQAKAKGEDIEPLKAQGEKLKNDSAKADMALG